MHVHVCVFMHDRFTSCLPPWPSLTSKRSSKLSFFNRHFHKSRQTMVVCVCVCVSCLCLYVYVHEWCVLEHWVFSMERFALHKSHPLFFFLLICHKGLLSLSLSLTLSLSPFFYVCSPCSCTWLTSLSTLLLRFLHSTWISTLTSRTKTGRYMLVCYPSIPSFLHYRKFRCPTLYTIHWN